MLLFIWKREINRQKYAITYANKALWWCYFGSFQMFRDFLPVYGHGPLAIDSISLYYLHVCYARRTVSRRLSLSICCGVVVPIASSSSHWSGYTNSPSKPSLCFAIHFNTLDQPCWLALIQSISLNQGQSNDDEMSIIWRYHSFISYHSVIFLSFSNFLFFYLWTRLHLHQPKKNAFMFLYCS